jgi:hypothetical protein
LEKAIRESLDRSGQLFAAAALDGDMRSKLRYECLSGMN